MTYLGYVGNHSVPTSTESYVAQALESLGHTVFRVQENTVNYSTAASKLRAWGVDVVFWTRTPSYRCDPDEQARFVQDCARFGIQTVGLHLDKYWDLDRQTDIIEHPWWRQDVVFTADGGNQDRFAAVGVNHHWWRPAVAASQCVRGQYRAEYASPIAFVGSQRYHREWPWRQQMIKYLNLTYRKRFRQFGRSGDRLADDQLSDAYASVKVVVGDSCGAGGTGFYWSNRIPETLGRGGFLLHPAVPGMEDHYADGQHLVTYKPGDARGLKLLIDRWLQDPDGRDRITNAGMRRVLERDTFEIRMREVCEMLGIGDRHGASDNDVGRVEPVTMESA